MRSPMCCLGRLPHPVGYRKVGRFGLSKIRRGRHIPATMVWFVTGKAFLLVTDHMFRRAYNRSFRLASGSATPPTNMGM